MNIQSVNFHACTISSVVAIVALSFFTNVSVGQEKEEFKLSDGSSRIVVSPWEKVDVGSDASFRGLHVVSDKVIWMSGTGGTVIVSSDGGKTWRQRKVEGAEELDFRDIHGFDDGTAVIISSGDVAQIYRTTNGGRTWTSCGKKNRCLL